jgi:hypothetical protein
MSAPNYLKSLSMKLTYAVVLEDFKTLQPPFTTRAGENAGFKGILVACGLISALGVFLLMQGFGLPVGLFLVGLGIVSGISAYFYEHFSVSRKEKEHKRKIELAFEQIHCRDQRAFEADEKGFTTACKCGTVTRPWSELTSFSENATHMAFSTRMGWQVLPKSAFPSQAEVTELRVLFSVKLNQDKTIASPHFDFALTPEDYRAAYWLHTLKGGGWRGLLRVCVVDGCILYGGVLLWNSIGAHNEAVRTGLIGGLIAVPLLKFAGKRRTRYFGPLRIFFGEEGLHLQDPKNQARIAWKQFAGYVENRSMILLYSSPKLYRIVPKRALTGPSAQFGKLVESKLRAFDYRNPVAPEIQQAGSLQRTS